MRTSSFLSFSTLGFISIFFLVGTGQINRAWSAPNPIEDLQARLYDIEKERKKNRELLLELMQNSTTQDQTEEQESLRKRQIHLGLEYNEIQNQLLILTQPLIIKQNTKDPEVDRSQKIQESMLKAEYSCNLKLIKDLIQRFSQKLNTKVQNAPTTYDNGHFVFLKTKKQLPDPLKTEIIHSLQEYPRLIHEASERANEEVALYPPNLNSIEIDDITLVLENLLNLKKKVVSQSYELENQIERAINQTIYKYQAKQILDFNYQAIILSRIPQNFFESEFIKLLQERSKSIATIEEIAKTSNLKKNNKPSTSLSLLNAEMQKIVENFRSKITAAGLEKNGPEFYLSELSTELKNNLKVSHFINSKEPKGLSKLPPFPISSHFQNKKKDLERHFEQFIRNFLGRAKFELKHAENSNQIQGLRAKHLCEIEAERSRLNQAFLRFHIENLAEITMDATLEELNRNKDDQVFRVVSREIRRAYNDLTAHLSFSKDFETFLVNYSNFIENIKKIKASAPKAASPQERAQQLLHKIADFKDLRFQAEAFDSNLDRLISDRAESLTRRTNDLIYTLSRFTLFTQNSLIEIEKQKLEGLETELSKMATVFEPLVMLSGKINWLKPLRIILYTQKPLNQISTLHIDFSLLDQDLQRIIDKVENELNRITRQFSQEPAENPRLEIVQQLVFNFNHDLAPWIDSLIHTIETLKEDLLEESRYDLQIYYFFFFFLTHCKTREHFKWSNPAWTQLDEILKTIEAFTITRLSSHPENLRTQIIFSPPLFRAWFDAHINSKTMPGIRNFGQTCYLNTLFKAIASTRLRHIFLNSVFQSSKSKTGKTLHYRDQIFLLVNALRNEFLPNDVIALVHRNTSDYFGREFADLFKNKDSSWENTQMDAPEVLEQILGKSSKLLTFQTLRILPKEDLSKAFRKAIRSSNLPQILLIHLARFDDKGRKLDQLVDPFKPELVHYRLKGIICHLGSESHCGHYIYASIEENRNIVIHDDEQVLHFPNAANVNELKNDPTLSDLLTNSYLLIYEKI